MVHEFDLRNIGNSDSFLVYLEDDSLALESSGIGILGKEKKLHRKGEEKNVANNEKGSRIHGVREC